MFNKVGFISFCITTAIILMIFMAIQINKEVNSRKTENKKVVEVIKKTTVESPKLQIHKKEKMHEVDFREAILFYGIRISLKGEEIDENQTLFLTSECTWVVGIFYNKKWHKAVILRDGNYKPIEGTPFKVKLHGSITLLMPESTMIRKEKK